MTNLELGKDVTIHYLQPFNGSGALRWKSGVIVKVTPKWILLDGIRGGWIPKDGIQFVR